MNNPTPRDSAQLPQCLGTNCTAPADHHSSECQAQHDATIGAQAASVEPVFVVTVTKSGALVEMEPTTAAFSLPSGRYYLYAGAPPSPASVAEVEAPSPMTAEFCTHFPKTAAVMINELARRLDDVQHPAPSPAQAVDAVSGQMLHEHYFLALYPHLDRFRGLDVWGELDQQEKAAWNRAALQASRQPQAQQGGGDCLTEIRDAISGYYLALDKREHGGIAQDRAFKKIEQALGMNWVQGAALATKEQRS